MLKINVEMLAAKRVLLELYREMLDLRITTLCRKIVEYLLQFFRRAAGQ